MKGAPDPPYPPWEGLSIFWGYYWNTILTIKETNNYGKPLELNPNCAILGESTNPPDPLPT